MDTLIKKSTIFVVLICIRWVLKACTYPVWIGLATGLTLSEVSVAGLLGIRESSSYSLGIGIGVCCC